MKLRKGDPIAVIIVLILAAAVFIMTLRKNDGSVVEVRSGGEIEYVLSLNDDAEVSVSGCTVKVSGGKVSVVSANCPDKVCEKTGEISKSGQSIICVPNRVEISVLGDAMYDAIAG